MKSLYWQKIPEKTRKDNKYVGTNEIPLVFHNFGIGCDSDIE